MSCSSNASDTPVYPGLLSKLRQAVNKMAARKRAFRHIVFTLLHLTVINIVGKGKA